MLNTINKLNPITNGGNTGLDLGNIGGLFAPRAQIVTENRIVMPVFSAMQTNTAITIADNSTVVIGGLLSEGVEKVEDKVPLLGDIPFVGRLFQSTASAPTKTAIVFMVHVRVVDAAGRPFNP